MDASERPDGVPAPPKQPVPPPRGRSVYGLSGVPPRGPGRYGVGPKPGPETEAKGRTKTKTKAKAKGGAVRARSPLPMAHLPPEPAPGRAGPRVRRPKRGASRGGARPGSSMNRATFSRPQRDLVCRLFRDGDERAHDWRTVPYGRFWITAVTLAGRGLIEIADTSSPTADRLEVRAVRTEAARAVYMAILTREEARRRTPPP